MEITLLDYQHKFITSTDKKLALLAGIGTGKSFTLAHMILNLIANHPGINILLAANTYSQLMNATVKAVTAEFDAIDIPYKAVLSGARKRIEVLGTVVYLYSLEKPDSIRGIEVGALLIDEACYADEYAYKVCVGRLRQKNMPLYIRIVSSPNGYNWVYDIFGENRIKAKTCDNVFLPTEYYEELVELYGGLDSPLAKQELLGEYVNLSGLNVYWAFKREVNCKEIAYNRMLPVKIGVDFNIDNMNAVVMQKDGLGHWHILKHIRCGEYNSNTYDLGHKILAWLTANKCQFFKIIPDSTGKARKTNSVKSDHEILKEILGKDCLETNVRNPSIKDRQNNVNRFYKNGKLHVNINEKEFIKETETLGREDKEGEKAHATVAAGYVLWRYDPMKRKAKFEETDL